jgi:DNA-binding NarL/FixJ family response regulator
LQKLQIARLVTKGLTNKEIVVQLALSPRTAEYTTCGRSSPS